MSTNPSIVNYLINKYRAALPEGQSPCLESFEKFSNVYLTENRTSTIQHLDGNFMLSLMNGDQVLICPSTTVDEVPGSTMPANAVPVTGGDSLGHVDFGDGIPVTSQPATTNVVDTLAAVAMEKALR